MRWRLMGRAICSSGDGFRWPGPTCPPCIDQANLGSAPTVFASPRTQTAEAGATVHLSVNAAGDSPLSYQWYFNGPNLLGCATSDLVLSKWAMHLTQLNGPTGALAAVSFTAYPQELSSAGMVAAKPIWARLRRRYGCRHEGFRLSQVHSPFLLMGYASDSTKRADRRSRCGFVHGIPTRAEFGWDGRGKAHLGAFATALRMSSRRL